MEDVIRPKNNILPVSPTFLRQMPQRFFFFFESLSPSLSSCSSLMEVPAISLVALALASGSFCCLNASNSGESERERNGNVLASVDKINNVNNDNDRLIKLTSLLVSMWDCCKVCTVGCAV